jgi:heat shock protein HtpX
MWEQIRSNQIKSVVLAISMGIVLVAIGYFLGLWLDSPIAGLVVALIIWMIMSLIAYFQGDSILLSVAGAKKINRDDHPRLYNVVEEMKIASGLEAMPDIYIIDDPAMNAFATGRSPKRAAVAVTTGLLQRMNRDELQGVIGHEIAHIKNRDVLLMSMLMVLLGTIVILSWYASRAIFFSGMMGGRSRSSSGGGGMAQLIILAVGLVLMILAPIFAQIIYFAVSRKREYLSDASSALYTRYPEGLASALEKLATNNTHVKAANKATAPMYTADPFQKKAMSANSLMSTHPPIAERVRILRAMGGASVADYERAYENIKGGHVVPVAALSAASPVSLRQASPNSKADFQFQGKLERSREASEAVWRSSNYRTIDCDCGTRLRIPPSFKSGRVRCPRCGRIHEV